MGCVLYRFDDGGVDELADVAERRLNPDFQPFEHHRRNHIVRYAHSSEIAVTLTLDPDGVPFDHVHIRITPETVICHDQQTAPNLLGALVSDIWQVRSLFTT